MPGTTDKKSANPISLLAVGLLIASRLQIVFGM